MKSELWIEETTQGIYGTHWKITDVHFKGKSEFQTVEVVETEGFGKMLLNDGLIMLTEKDEFIYHDMIAHVPLFVHPNPKNVLVIGGGDGGTAREVLRHNSVEKCTMVEIDKMVVDASREFIPQTSKDLDHPKMNLIIGDGLEFVKNTKEVFDVIIVDSTDPIGPATPLFGEEFYRDVSSCLSDDGIVVSQGESPFFNVDMQKSLLGIVDKVFPISTIYNFTNLGYPGGLWSFTLGSKKYHPIKDFDAQKVEASELKFGYYNAQVHQAAFSIPQFMLDELGPFIKG